jgi:type I restriction enzyme S subunit
VSELPSGWAWAALAELGAEVRASVVPATDVEYELYSVPAFATGAPELVRGSAIGSAKRAVDPGDVLLCKINPRINRVWIVNNASGRPQIASPEYLIFRTTAPGLARYVRWYLTSPRFREWIKLSVEGATGSHTRAKSGPILRQLVPVPPLAEQQRIVAAIEEQLSRLDAAGQSLAQAKSKLAALRTATVAVAIEGFESAALGDLVTELRYGTSAKCSYDATGPPVLRIPNVQGGVIDVSDLKYATEAQLDLSAFSVANGDLLFVRTNGSRDLIGRVASVDGAEGMAFASYLIRARPDPARLDPRFAVIALSTPKARAVIESKAATTAGQYNLNLAALRSLQVPLPPIDQQRSIVAEVDYQLAAADTLETEVNRVLRHCAALRRSILVCAFRGELVSQDPDDEPASVLLERIAAERAPAEKATARRPRRRERIGAE